MKVTTIFFDFVGVLMQVDPFITVSDSGKQIDQRIGAVVDDRTFRESALNDFGLSEQQFEAVLDQIGDRYKPFDPLWQMLPELRKTYRIGIINNGTWLTYPRFNARYALDQRFDLFVSSAVEGVRKPHPQIYLRACEKMHVLPAQCLFLDDSQENVSAAVQVGMQGIWWETHPIGLQQFNQWLLSEAILP
jgi:HAD superfamily hydrolase (TIGR01509 family)